MNVGFEETNMIFNLEFKDVQKYTDPFVQLDVTDDGAGNLSIKNAFATSDANGNVIISQAIPTSYENEEVIIGG